MVYTLEGTYHWYRSIIRCRAPERVQDEDNKKPARIRQKTYEALTLQQQSGWWLVKSYFHINKSKKPAL